jgi:hypothetical protein
VLVVVAYAPIMALGAPFGWPGRVRVSDALPWPVLDQAVCIAGGLAWAMTALAYQRRSRGACAHCGRADVVADWTTLDGAARWGRWAISTAVVIPVIYALTRFTWAVGIPLGITAKFFREGQAIGLWWRGAALGALAVIGALLTLGLGQGWGEVSPRWFPAVGGRKVPLLVVVIPATMMSVFVMAAGLMFVRMGIAGTVMLGDNRVTFIENWAALWPELCWPIWGVALGAATLAYYYRTRSRCDRCGRS